VLARGISIRDRTLFPLTGDQKALLLLYLADQHPVDDAGKVQESRLSSARRLANKTG